ncbi:hypothetical protein MO973_31785 [Paenibacillus sp. TRM 82003]|uniref:hypothetical protein n=1 Tax=Kineococcus sp. TRM81007 TaxID=2925831 RepID=UPI001F58160E|nr:hypothetical protein [Kineococcus sp. TRM81007]MCI2239120.1 hypothetical protein [Kineococcus sp. TRM81007]MCI3924799.1 hypothetical protein [Paenibacillus sp. TRM 82003]
MAAVVSKFERCSCSEAEVSMSWLDEMRRKPADDSSASAPGEQSLLGVDSWEGAGRWPEDDSPAPRTDEPEGDLWVNVDPGRPSAGI